MPFFAPATAAVVAPIGVSSPPHLYNWQPASQLLNFRGAKALVHSGKAGARCIIACSGDSTTAGYDGANVNRGTTSMPARLAARLSAMGIPATIGSFAGNGNYPNGDPRIVQVGSGGWSGAGAFGGDMATATGSGNGFNFAPGVAFDRVDIDYFDLDAKTFTIGVDGGPATTITNGGTGNMTSTTLTLSGTSSSVIQYRASADQTYLQGVRVWSSTAPTMEVVNGGRGGDATDGGIATPTGFTRLSGLLAIKPKLALVNFGINDANSAGITASAFQANLTAAVTALQAAGSDVILILPTPIAYPTPQALIAGDFYTALKAISDAKNVPVLSWGDRYQSFAKAAALFGQTDNLHPSMAMYDDEAAYLAGLLATV